ncbi:twitch domain-containing radical SAM protein [Agarivorans aestuarii]|uniref:Twitch domain-containing radical SAM protein n=1 Tax=Agarivorans aestuarii TaxID=1563703 RepID=A0ABU7G9M8_9ALTE|nr:MULTISPECIES: twitch domain-containing radical SAM protein [Agarivorans]MEE1676087.1 twitch domain-containing radical SAM protein [Agarivorans aestuarii]
MASNCICPLPWNHAYVEMNGDVKLCCVAQPALKERNLIDTPVSEFVDSRYMAHIRKQMLMGMWPVECGGCKKAELLGLESHRTGIINRDPQSYQQLTKDPSEDKVKLSSLDLRISNECNFKCRSCSVSFSNAWRDDFQAIYPNNISVEDLTKNRAIQGIEGNTSFWDQLDERQLGDIKEWHFAGGEALLSDKHYQLLEKLISIKAFDSKITYTTNFSIIQYKHWNILEMLKPFHNVVFHLSLDGAGEKGEYIRKGLNWKRWLKNLRLLRKSLPKAKLDIHFVVSILNILDLQWHIQQIEDVNEFRDPATKQLNVGFTCLDRPSHLSIQVLSPELKKKAKQRLVAISEHQATAKNIREAMVGIINFLDQKDLHQQQFREFLRTTTILDQRRKEDYRRLFPELAEMELTKV